MLQTLSTNGRTANAGQTVVAIKKSELYAGQFISTTLEITNGLPIFALQPAVNFDDVPTNGPAWVVGKGPSEVGTNFLGGAVWYRRLGWSNSVAGWVDTNWVVISNSAYRDYYDLEGTNGTILFATNGVTAPEATAEGGVNIDLYSVGSQLMMAQVRNGFLWTCHMVGLNGTNGVYAGDATGTNVDRSAIQWLKFQVSPDAAGLSYYDHGRVFDPAPTNAWWYYFPSLAVNCAGDMVMGFSGSSPTNYIAALYASRLVGGPALTPPRVSVRVRFSMISRVGATTRRRRLIQPTTGASGPSRSSQNLHCRFIRGRP